MYKGKNTYTILRLKQGFDRRLSTIGKSLRFTIPYSKANNKSKSVWWSIHPAPKSLPCIWFSESRILTLGHPHKHCRISLVDEPSSDKSMDSASQTNIYRSFTTLRFCVTPIRSSVDKVITSSRVFPSARVCLLLGRSWGLWVMAHLITCSPWTYHRATDHYSNFQLPSILKSIQLYCLPSFYWHQIKTWLLRLIMEFPLIHISNIIPPLYPIVIHLFILGGYPTYRDKKHLYLWSPYSTSWNIIILSRVKRPYRGILAISAWHFFNWETWNTSWTPDSPSGNSNL